MTNHILLLGAHGNVSMKMIPLLLRKTWNVTALIRNAEQRDEIMSKIPKDAKEKLGTLDVLVHSLADVKTSDDAASVIKKAKGVNWIVWSAGAGGGKQDEPKEVKDARTNAIDRDAAVAFAHAAGHDDQIERYLTISALSSRRSFPAGWWDQKEKEEIPKMAKAIGVYSAAKLLADECLTVWGDERQKRDNAFKYIVLRPGGLVDKYEEDGKDVTEKKAGKIQLGRTNYELDGKLFNRILRQDVAETAVELLDKGANGWFDLLQGNTPIEKAVTEAIGAKLSAVDGENKDDMKKTADKAFSDEWDSYGEALVKEKFTA